MTPVNLGAFEFRTNTAGDLDIAGGDFVVAESDVQHIADIMLAVPGDFKQYPLVGVNMAAFVNAPNSAEVVNQVRMNIQLQLEADGFLVNSISMGSGIVDIVINAERVK